MCKIECVCFVACVCVCGVRVIACEVCESNVCVLCGMCKTVCAIVRGVHVKCVVVCGMRGLYVDCVKLSACVVACWVCMRSARNCM